MALLFEVAVVAVGETVDEDETGREVGIDEGLAVSYLGFELVWLE